MCQGHEGVVGLADVVLCGRLGGRFGVVVMLGVNGGSVSLVIVVARVRVVGCRGSAEASWALGDSYGR